MFSCYIEGVEVIALEPYGFCEGVSRAFEMAEEALQKGHPFYALGLVVHNEKVINSLRERGMA